MRFPNPKLVSHGRFAPSLRVADSYVGATSGPRLGPGVIFVGLLSSGTPGRPIHRSRGVTPSSAGAHPTKHCSLILQKEELNAFSRGQYLRVFPTATTLPEDSSVYSQAK